MSEDTDPTCDVGEQRHVYCPNCGEVLEASTTLAGLKVRCSSCKRIFTMPEDEVPAAQMLQAELVGEPSAEPRAESAQLGVPSSDHGNAAPPSTSPTAAATMDRAVPIEQVDPTVTTEAAGSTGSPTVGVLATEPRPWLRWTARFVDYRVAAFVVGLPLGYVISSAAPEAAMMMIPSFGWSMLIVAGWIFVEAALLELFGCTPGKWLLQIHIAEASGSKPSSGAALNRSRLVWLRGVGTGFPLVALFTMRHAYYKLKETGTTSWDSDTGLTAVQGTVTAFNIVVAWLWIVVSYFIEIILLVWMGS